MKLSIITINYNNSEGLERTINSIINQSFSDFEYLVIDGGSTDGSVDVISKYSENIDYWISESDSGVYNAMNKGIKRSLGEYVLFINSGDALYEECTLSKVFAFNLKQDLVYGDLHRIFPNGYTDIVRMPTHVTVQHIMRSVLTHPTTFIKKCLFDKYGLYREDLKIVSDWAFFLKLIAFTNTSQIHVPLVISSFEMNGMSSNNDELVQLERFQVINEQFSPELNHICFSQERYREFYEKPIFRKLRLIKAQIIKSKKILKKLLEIRFSYSKFIEYIYSEQIHSLIWLTNKTVRRQKSKPYTIPIIIINYNRLTDLRLMVDFFVSINHQNIVIVDNASTYQPLLKYYDEIKGRVKVLIMDKNYGHLVLWQNEELYKKFMSGYYIVSDSDIIPNKDLPRNYLLKMLGLLDHYEKITKVGFALDIDNIPDCFKSKDKVIKWEQKYWDNPIDRDVYVADTDTTFALYRPNYKYSKPNFLKAIRIAGNFTAIHRGWYIDSRNLSEEDIYYYKTSNASNTWKLDENGEFSGEFSYYE